MEAGEQGSASGWASERKRFASFHKKGSASGWAVPIQTEALHWFPRKGERFDLGFPEGSASAF